MRSDRGRPPGGCRRGRRPCATWPGHGCGHATQSGAAPSAVSSPRHSCRGTRHCEGTGAVAPVRRSRPAADEDIRLVADLHPDLSEVVGVDVFRVPVHLLRRQGDVPVEGLPLGEGSVCLVGDGAVQRQEVLRRPQGQCLQCFILLRRQGAVLGGQQNVAVGIVDVERAGRLLRDNSHRRHRGRPSQRR